MLDAGPQPRSVARRAWTEFLVFGVKQAWACTFGAVMLVVIVLARLSWPPSSPIDRNDALTIAAVLIQVGMLAFGLESFRELRVVLLFHVVGTGMELFKTGVGSWAYEPGGLLHIGAVPLYSGFMYAAVGSYLVRVYRLFDLGFTRYPPVWASAVLAAAIYANFFTHHVVWDARYLLLGALVLLFARTTMHVRVYRGTMRMPVLVAFGLVAVFIWLAENIATWAGAWYYPAQAVGWQPVAPTKIVAWLLLMTISVVLVTWVYPPRRVVAAAAARAGDVSGPGAHGLRGRTSSALRRRVPSTPWRWVPSALRRRVPSGLRWRVPSALREPVSPVQVLASVLLAVPTAAVGARVAVSALAPVPAALVTCAATITAMAVLHVLARLVSERLGSGALPWALWAAATVGTWSLAGMLAGVGGPGVAAVAGAAGILAVLLAVRTMYVTTHRPRRTGPAADD